MRATLLVASVELRRRLRNRSAIFTAFIGPLLLAAVFGVLLGGTSSFILRIGVVDADRSDVTAEFVRGLLSGLGRKFGTPVRTTLMRSKAEGADHDVFLVEWQGR